GHLMARNMLGRCWEHGWGGPVDCTLASLEYRQAAEAGLDWALYNYANLLATGRGVTQDQNAAYQLYRVAAQAGHAKSMNLLGRYLEEGEHCPADKAEACLWYERSARGGDFRGQFSHASVLAEDGNIDDALRWFERALNGGNLNFLRVTLGTLLEAREPRIRALSAAWQVRIDALQGNNG
ncbi:MAG: sel1 repeat family protein, partial [Pseudomonas sp.]|nr:sel1 repeat family protein [Pseudomonas sp.]